MAIKEALEADVVILGVTRPRYEWEMLDGYLNARGVLDDERAGWTIGRVSRDAYLRHGPIEPPDGVTTNLARDWRDQIARVLDWGCVPYRYVEDVQTDLRDRIIFLREFREWCYEGTNSALDQLGLARIDEDQPIERFDDDTIDAFLRRFRRYVDAMSGVDEQPNIWRAINRGVPPRVVVMTEENQPREETNMEAAVEIETIEGLAAINAELEQKVIDRDAQIERYRATNERLERAIQSHSRFVQQVRAKIIAMGEEYGWDTHDVNEILDELGLDLIEQDYDVTIEVQMSGYWTTTVTASDDDAARELALDEANGMEFDGSNLDNVSVDNVEIYEVTES